MKSDSQLRRDILAELNSDPSVNVETIGVEVNEAIITLAGHVDSFSEKWHTERAAQRVSDVKGLIVAIEVSLPESSRRTDEEIACSAENVLRWMTHQPQDSIHVQVENGWITLSGEVEWGFRRRNALKAVRYLTGVIGVSDTIAIKPRTSSAAVKAEIEAALMRRGQLHAQQITVHVRGADVTLSGTVQSRTEREVAASSAWRAPGVRNVVDNITIAH